MKEESIEYRGATCMGSIAGAAFQWAWWDLALYSGVFLCWNPNGSPFIFTSLVIGMFASSLSLFLAARFSDRAMRLVQNKRFLLVCAGLAGASSLIMIIAGSRGFIVLIVITSVLNGLELGILESLWGFVCSEYGARSASINVSLAIALGIAIDAILYFAMHPLAVAVTTCFFPLLSTILFVRRSKPQLSPELMTRSPRSSCIESPSEQSLLHKEVYGISIIFIVGIVICETAFNYLDFRFAYSPYAAFSGFLFNFPYLLARGIGAALCFICIGIFHFPRQRCFTIAIFIMSIAFVLLPFLDTWGMSLYISNLINMACFAWVAIFALSVFCEISFYRHLTPFEPVSFGLIFYNIVVAFGLLLGSLVDVIATTPAQFATVSTIVGYVLVLGLVAILFEGLRCFKHVSTYDIPEDAAAREQGHTTGIKTRVLSDLAKTYSLTNRESGIYAALLRGHSVSMIADEMDLSENTVKSHLRSLYKKFDVHNKEEAVKLFEESYLDAKSSVAVTDRTCENTTTNLDPDPSGRMRQLDPVLDELSREHGLTEREQEVFVLLARGYHISEIEDRLFISYATVRSHITNIYAKMGIHSHGELVKLIKGARLDDGKRMSPEADRR